MVQKYPKQVFINGNWLAPEEAKISVFDRGFLLGDGIYEVIPFYNRKFYRLEQHLDRLSNGLSTVGIQYDIKQLINDISIALIFSGSKDGIVYIQITRGIAPRTHSFPNGAKPSVIIYSQPYSFEGFRERRASVVIHEDFRWHRCDIKSTSLMANVLLNQAGTVEGYFESLLQRDGVITEGTYTSVFFVKKSKIYTHPEGPSILPGITRKIVIELCEILGVEVIEETIFTNDLYQMDGAFLAGTTAQITKIENIDFWDDGNRRISYQDIKVIADLQNLFYQITKGRGE